MRVFRFERGSLSIAAGVVLLLVVVGLSSCATRNRLLSSWIDPAVAGSSGQKVEDTLVIGVARDATIRRLFENSFARGLGREGVRSFKGHTVEAVQETVNYETVLQASEATGAKTVLITRLADFSRITESGDSLGRRYGVLKDAPMDYGLMVASTMQVSTTSNKLQLVLESLLYEVKTRKLLWSARTEVTDPVMTNTFIDSATELFFEDLKKHQLL
jgi:hypothetical protein